jgi:hypothetical protein
MPLPQIDVAETDQAYYFQMEIPKAYKQNTKKGVYKMKIHFLMMKSKELWI